MWMKKQGWVEAFYWAFNMRDADTYVRSLPGPDNAVRGGSLLLGTPWYESMFNPVYRKVATGVYKWCLEIDETKGGVAGGHEIVIDGRNSLYGAWRILNSWGPWWGVNGRAWLRDETLNRLIAEGADLLLLMEKKGALA
jgi:hypothetical protein